MGTSKAVRGLTTSFVEQIAAAVDADVQERVADALERMFNGSAGRSAGPRKAAAQPKRERRSLSPAATRARKLQGKYLGALRSLKGRDRDKVKAIARTKGVAKAITVARALAAKG